MVSPGFKRIASILQGLLLSCCCFFGYHLLSQSYRKQLRDLNADTGVIVKSGEVVRNSSTAKGPISLSGLELRLKNNNKIFRYYDSSQDFSQIGNDVSLGDSVKIYYEEIGKEYVDIAQLEHQGVEIIKLRDFKTRKSIAAYIAFAGGILLLGLTVYQDSKHWKQK